jgi:hypothetical protein
MKYITRLINRFFIREENQIKHLGRWNIENCSKKINKKIDFSNEDHCGPCGQTKNGLHHLMLKRKEVK